MEAAGAGQSRIRQDVASSVQDVLVGYQGDSGDDPPAIRLVRMGKELEPGEVFDRQSVEIEKDFPLSPINKQHRQRYNWVARTAGGRYTRDPEKKMAFTRSKFMIGKWTCDVCGATCSDSLFMFRGYQRKEFLQTREGSRVLDPFVAYISEMWQRLAGCPQ